MAKGPTGNIGKAWRKQATRGYGVNRKLAQQQDWVNRHPLKINAVSELLANLMDRAGLILAVPQEEVAETA